jgi:hypothetical protein
MLWRMFADSRSRRIGVMSNHRIRKACGEPPSRPAASCHQPVPQTLMGRGNCPIVLSPQFPEPLYGAKEFPVAMGPSGAISCRVASHAGRSTDGRSPIAENAAPNLGNLPNLSGWLAGRRQVDKRVAEIAGTARTPPGRSESLSAAQRGRGWGPLRSNGRVRWCSISKGP